MSECPHGESGRFCCGYVGRGLPCPFLRSPVVRFAPAEMFMPECFRGIEDALADPETGRVVRDRP